MRLESSHRNIGSRHEVICKVSPFEPTDAASPLDVEPSPESLPMSPNPTGARATAAETAVHPCRELTGGVVVSDATGTRAAPAQETAWQFAAGVAVQTYQSAIMSGPLRKSSGCSKLPPNLTKRTLNTRSASHARHS